MKEVFISHSSNITAPDEENLVSGDGRRESAHLHSVKLRVNMSEREHVGVKESFIGGHSEGSCHYEFADGFVRSLASHKEHSLIAQDTVKDCHYLFSESLDEQ